LIEQIFFLFRSCFHSAEIEYPDTMHIDGHERSLGRVPRLVAAGLFVGAVLGQWMPTAAALSCLSLLEEYELQLVDVSSPTGASTDTELQAWMDQGEVTLVPEYSLDEDLVGVQLRVSKFSDNRELDLLKED
jgi:hypothetical protein